jgi:hypothetical protein
MTSVKHSTILFLVFALLCGYPGVFAQGSQGATGQQPLSPRISPPSPPLMQPPAPPAPLPQSTEGGSGEPIPITKSGNPQSPMHPQTSIRKSNEGQSAQDAEGQISLAGCVMQNRGHYELLDSSGDRFALTGKTARLRVGSVVALYGNFLPRGENQNGSSWTGSLGPEFSVDSFSLLSFSCDIAGREGGNAQSAAAQGREGSGGETPSTKRNSLAIMSPQSPVPAPTQSPVPAPTHLQAALAALKKAEQELIAAEGKTGSQSDLALRTVQVAIGNLELAEKRTTVSPKK